jgi:hypothetical protein
MSKVCVNSVRLLPLAHEKILDELVPEIAVVPVLRFDVFDRFLLALGRVCTRLQSRKGMVTSPRNSAICEPSKTRRTGKPNVIT